MSFHRDRNPNDYLWLRVNQCRSNNSYALYRVRHMAVMVASLFSILQLNGQEKFSDNLKLSAHYHHGVNLPEYEFFSYITHGYVQSADLCISKETSGKNEWEDLYNYPEHGVSLFFTSLGNNQVYGLELSCNYFFRLNIVRTDRFSWYTRFGTGMGYVNRRFDPVDNYLNLAIGSHVNIHFNSRMGGELILSERLNAGFGISFDHLSNANTSPINLGINTTTLFAGISYFPGERKEKLVPDRPKHKPRNYIELVSSVGGKVIRNASFESKYYAVPGLSTELSRSFFRGFHLGIGADVFLDLSIKDAQLSNGNNYSPYQSWQTGLHVSQSVVYNRFSVTIQQGFYVGLQNVIYHKAMYNRGIIKFRVTEHFTLRLTMRSHIHILDFPEIGFGYRF